MKNVRLSLTTKAEVYKQIDALIASNPSQGYFLNITKRENKRSNPANSVYQSWYGPISDHMALTINEATRYVKLTFGLPILFSNKDFGFVVRDGMESNGFFNLDYERQLELMDKIPVTRLFTTPMHNKLRDDLQYFFGQQGLALEYER
jgi:hypothetical protein